MKNSQNLEALLGAIGDKEIGQRVKNFFSKDVEFYANSLAKLKKGIAESAIPLDKATAQFSAYTKTLLEQSEKLANDLGQRVLVKKVKDLFRAALADSPVYESLLIRRAHDKPRGYPGDYQMLEYIYNNQPISRNIGHCGDAYILNDDYVVAVRNRKDMMKNLLRDFFKINHAAGVKILNLGCGSCREIRELFSEGFTPEFSASFSLFDQDEEAIVFCRNNLNAQQQSVKFNFFREDIVNLFRQKRYKDVFNAQDLIYSIGLADYLPNISLGSLIQACFSLLKPKGQLVIAHKNVTKYSASAPDWFCNWYFFPRNKDGLYKIIKANLDASSCNVDFYDEKSSHIFFVAIIKR